MIAPPPPSPVELWASLRSVDDVMLDVVARLGVRALRVPLRAIDDEHLARLRTLGIRPIITLVDDATARHTADFPHELAERAADVALRHPWVEDFCPVDKPLEHARSHDRDPATVLRSVVNQMRGVRSAMESIRQHNPCARLLQTEHLTLTHSTELLGDQADDENDRRWLTFDLLTGRVRPDHPLHDALMESGITVDELAQCVCPPDVLGMHYDLTSERFLDERIMQYPAELRARNRGRTYADVDAMHVAAPGIRGHAPLMREVWARYGLPLAVVDCDLSSTREEQLRWLAETWHAIQLVRREGIHVVALDVGDGAIEVRAPLPRLNAVGRAVQQLAGVGSVQHPVLDEEGAWRRDTRLLYTPVGPREMRNPSHRRPPRPILTTGAGGMLGRAFTRVCAARGLNTIPVHRGEVDIADQARVEMVLDHVRPWAVVNAAGFSGVDEAEQDPARCQRDNASGPSVLAVACAQRGIQLVTFSSALVFDGQKRTPYVESDAARPLSEFGRSKLIAERAVLFHHRTALVIRTGPLFSPWDFDHAVGNALMRLGQGLEVVESDDARASPTSVMDLVHAALDLLVDGEVGLWHLANQGSITGAELARRTADIAGLRASLVVGRRIGALGLAAPRPLSSVLGSERTRCMPSLDDALVRCVRELRALRAAA